MRGRKGRDVAAASERSRRANPPANRAGVRQAPFRASSLRRRGSQQTARLPAKNRGAESGRVEIQPLGRRNAAPGEPADLKPVRWEEHHVIPRCVSALLAGQANRLPHLATVAEWEAALYYFDRNQFTLMLPRTGLPHD